MRELPAQGGAFNVALGLGDGRLYAIGPAGALAAVRNEVLKNRISIERDLQELERIGICNSGDSGMVGMKSDLIFHLNLSP